MRRPGPGAPPRKLQPPASHRATPGELCGCACRTQPTPSEHTRPSPYGARCLRASPTSLAGGEALGSPLAVGRGAALFYATRPRLRQLSVRWCGRYTATRSGLRGTCPLLKPLMAAFSSVLLTLTSQPDTTSPCSLTPLCPSLPLPALATLSMCRTFTQIS